MKLVKVTGTVDLLGDASEKAHGLTYDHVSFLTAGGDEVLVHNLCVDDEVEHEFRLGVTGEFTLQKSLFSTILQSIRIASPV